MRVRLLKRHKTSLGDYAMGTVLQVTRGFGEKLIKQRIGELYSDEYPPKKKMKTELFKPKNKWQ